VHTSNASLFYVRFGSADLTGRLQLVRGPTRQFAAGLRIVLCIPKYSHSEKCLFTGPITNARCVKLKGKVKFYLNFTANITITLL